MLAAFLLDPTAGVRARRGGRRSGSAACCCRPRADDRRQGARPALEGIDGRARGAVGRRDHARAAADRATQLPARLDAERAVGAVSRRRAAGRAAARRDRARRHLTSTSRTSSKLVGRGRRASSPSSSARSTRPPAREFNIGSPKQLGELLFDKLGLDTKGVQAAPRPAGRPRPRRSRQLIDAHPMIAPILEHRELIKLKGTYLDALPPLVNPQTGRVHTTFNQVVAETGRISSQDPNLQNIPIRSELGRQIRRGFVAAPGHVLIAADYSQIELRILAHLSGDPLLGDGVPRSRSTSTPQTAAEVFGVAREEVTAEQRRIAKAVNYGLSYGQSDFGLARALDDHAHPGRRVLAALLPAVPDDPQVHGRHRHARARAGRGAHAARPLAADPEPDVEVAAGAPRRRARRAEHADAGRRRRHHQARDARDRARGSRARSWPVQMLLTVHDELVFEAPPEIAEEVGAALKQEMEGVYQLERAARGRHRHRRQLGRRVARSERAGSIPRANRGGERVGRAGRRPGYTAEPRPAAEARDDGPPARRDRVDAAGAGDARYGARRAHR